MDDDSATYKKVVRKDEYESKVVMRIKPRENGRTEVHSGSSRRKVPSDQAEASKELGRWYNADLSDREQLDRLRKGMMEGLEKKKIQIRATRSWHWVSG